MNITVATTKPNIVNGINVDALTALLGRVKQDASQGQTAWRVTTTWQGQARSRANVSGRSAPTILEIRFCSATDSAGEPPASPALSSLAICSM